MGIGEQERGVDKVTEIPCEGSSNAVEIDLEIAPPLPEIAWSILKVTTDLKTGVVQLEAIIRRDQALTSELLRIANSEYFGLVRKVDSLRHASEILGSRRLRTLAVTVSLGGVMQKSAFGESLWEHSLGVAHASAAIADETGYSDREKAFLAGMLHDIGKSALNNQYPELFIESLQLAQRKRIHSIEAERLVLGIDHCQVGAKLADHWNLPETLEEVVELHHEPLSASEDWKLVSIVNLADGLCLKMGLGGRLDMSCDLRKLESWRSLEVKEAQIYRVSEKVASALERDKRFLGLV
jgi:putative nucleotidyltransferase with HDIG domain